MRNQYQANQCQPSLIGNERFPAPQAPGDEQRQWRQNKQGMAEPPMLGKVGNGCAIVNDYVQVG